MHIVWLVFAILLLWASPSEAACSGSSPTRTAASANQTDVGDCLTVASSGDTIFVPPGSAVWADFIIEAEVTIQGAGIGQTIISCSDRCFRLSTQVNQRITGFSFQFTGPGDADIAYIGKGYTVVPGKAFRVDHNSFDSPSHWWTFEVYGSDGPVSSAIHETGLFDHNTFHNAAVKVYATDLIGSDDGLAHQAHCWTQQAPLGQGTEYVYIEDNIFTGDISATRNAGDGNQCGRYVYRFNTISNLVTGIEVHGVQGGNRAVQRWEFYKNTINMQPGSFTNFFIRGGTGVVFGNRTSQGQGFDLLINNERSQNNVGGSFGACDGTSTNGTDQTTPGMSGYACRDQIGSGFDMTQWVFGVAYSQTRMPAYFWDNLKGTTPATATTPFNVIVSTAIDGSIPAVNPPTGYDPIHLVANRDFYNEIAGFTGASGVGIGTLAARPATCTTGVGYWATDQGEWNSLQAGADGQLYKCTATNTWTLYYTPFPYPHFLQTARGSSSAPSAPTNLKVQ